MLLQSLKVFIEREEIYAEKLASYEHCEELAKNDHEKILDVLCEFLTNPQSTEDVAECFPQLLPALVSASISTKKVSYKDGDTLHKLNCVVLGKLLCKNRDLLGFVLHYFDANPAPFESVQDDYTPSAKKRNKGMLLYREVSDYDLVTACYDILCCAPMHFKYTWNWSKFYKYLAADDEAVRWVSINCIAIVLDMSETCMLSHMDSLVPNSHKYAISCQQTSQNSEISIESEEVDQMVNNLPSVVSIGGILLPVFNTSKSKKEQNLVPVPSTRRNLQNLALAVSSNKCICLQGAVGSGKTALVDFLAEATGHNTANFAKVQLGDQTDSKMLLGMYLCTDIPGEFLWQPGILTEAVLSGKWLLLEDIDCAPTDVISVIGQLVENKTLSVPGYRDSVRIKSGFQLFVSVRSTAEGSQKSLKMSQPLQKHWSCVNVEPLSKEELVTVVQTSFPALHTAATRIVNVFLLFSVGNHEEDADTCVRNTRQTSTRDLMKWCCRAIIDYDVSSPVSTLKIFQDALDIFCCSVPNCAQRVNLAISVAHKLGIVNTKAMYFCNIHKPSVDLGKEILTVGRAKLRIKKSARVQLPVKSSNFSYTRPSVCLLERIASCVAQKEPVLLVGETGTGKTSCIQYLAQITGHKLVVINMNQQSESTDLLGGYKPVDFKLLILPIREEFEILFRSYYAIEPNRKFLSHIGQCFEERKWKSLTSLMIHSTSAALKRLKSNSKNQDALQLLKKWNAMARKLEKLQSQVQSNYSLAFSFVEGGLVKALKNGDWVLLDEINLATAETLECLSGLLEGSCGSLSLLERGDKEPLKRHADFAIFACMNPATDVGKKDLPVGLRNRFTEFFVDELTDKSDLQLLANSYLKDLNLAPNKIDGIVNFYLSVRKEAEKNLLDGTGHKPHYSLRTLCRALSVSSQNPCGNALRSLFEAFCLSFLTQLDSQSYQLVLRMIVKAILGEKDASAILKTPIPKPGGVSDSFICFEGYWIPRGNLSPRIPENYVLTETVKQNLKDLVRVVSIGKMPVLLQGDTSVGKTSLITYLAKASGHTCVRINNHEHTDLQEYVGTYVADYTGKLVFKEGVLVDAMRKGYWIILDELNLAPSDVLEALNRVLDDNRELYIPETQQVVKAHDKFMLFATQNPPGLYGGRKVLSRAFRNRFVELHFDEIPPKELQVILHKRCQIPETYCKQVINVMTELQVRRKGTATFAGKKGFITLRDLFRWAERYRLAPDQKVNLYDWSQHLADEGYLVLSSKVRHPEECLEIVQVLKKHLKRDVDVDSLFSLSAKTSPVTKPILESLLLRKIPGFEHIVWTFPMRKMAVLLTKACDFKEPVLLIGETGGGKTTVCQLLSAIRQQKLSIVNCHMHTEASDFLGSLRPVRDHTDSQKLFEWVDGPLVKAMKNGGFFLVDEISLADDSVLERLNSLLEPERKLLIAEKSSSDYDATVSASEDFIFVGTMNPGGDYGKKELSPALRNRFTEIWCEGCVSFDDLKCIAAHNLRDELKKNVPTAIIAFLEWLQTTEIGKKLVVSVRDVLTWVNFINCCKNLAIGDAFFHGAALSYIDGLGSGATAAENITKLKDFKASAMQFIKCQVNNTMLCYKSKLMLNCEESAVENLYNKFGISPFYVQKAYEEIPKDLEFAFKSPTTRINTLKVLRAMQLKKPILLEGSPGVGKTSLVSALARATGHQVLRLNLSDQTDISDLFGADLPVEGGKPGEFSWRDGPFLRALKNGDWILLDELNLASQSVLEGLNACLDHRGEVYIPELGMTFTVKPGTRLFGCQNPLCQGGARRGLPKSFLNRFTQVFVDVLEPQDLSFILKAQFPKLPQDLMDSMIIFNERVRLEAGITWGHSGSPWEFNLRDLTRWCELTMASLANSFTGDFNPGRGAQLIYVNRMRTEEDKHEVTEIYHKIFSEVHYPLPDPEFPVHFTKEKIFLGDEVFERGDSAVYEDENLLLLRDQKPLLKDLAHCVNMNWMTILVGDTGTGKTSLVHLLANLAGRKLKSIVVNSAMDTTEILGGFEQTDYDRHFEELLERTETLLIETLRTRLQKENLDQVSHYHALLENIRHLSKDDGETTETTMLTETKLFLRKAEKLSRLVSAMKTLASSSEMELREIDKKLTDLSIVVEKDKCLNAGGKFEWVDSVLVKCLKDGTWLLLDQVNLCSPAILDRLNGLLEPNGSLTIGEKGVDESGNVVTVRAHKNFRLFLTMNPRYGEISRAMRNRGVEIAICQCPPLRHTHNSLDIRSLLYKCGIEKIHQQDLLLQIYDTLQDERYRLNDVLRIASFASQQIAKGFPFKKSLRNSYREFFGALDYRSRNEAMRMVDEILSGDFANNEKLCCDLATITLGTSGLRKDSKLAMVEQQGFLLKFSVEMLASDSEEIDLKPLFMQKMVTKTSLFLKFLLLDFYGRSSLADVQIRRVWSSFILSTNGFDEFDKLSKILHREVKAMTLLFERNSDEETPLYIDQISQSVNNLSVALYFRAMIFDCQQRKQSGNGDVMLLEEYSSAVCSGKLTSNLKDEPLIINFAKLLDESIKIIDRILHTPNLTIAHLLINSTEYIKFRSALLSFQRYYDLGSIELIDRSRGTFLDLREISSSLKVHYKWLVKHFKQLFDIVENKWLDGKLRTEIKDFSANYLSVVINTDKFRKLRKKIIQYFSVPSPHCSEKSMSFHDKLRLIFRKIEVTEEDSIEVSKTRLKIASLALAENLSARRKLIDICTDNYKNGQKTEDTEELDDLDTEITTLKEIEVKQIRSNENLSEIELWPIYEFFFLLFAYSYQRKICQQFSLKFGYCCTIISGEFNRVSKNRMFEKFEKVPTIPAHLIGLMKSLNSYEIEGEDRLCLFLELLMRIEEFSERSFAVKDSDVLLKWFEHREDEIQDNNSNSRTNFISKSNLCKLIFELFLTKSGNKMFDINLGNHKNKKKLLKTIQTILWRNSLVLNTPEFNLSTNDSILFRFCSKYYTSTITHVLNSCGVTVKKDEEKDFSTHFLKPLKSLEDIIQNLELKENDVERGKGWLILGYLQIFLFHDLGPIDPVQKIVLKTKYSRENVSELEYMLLIENLQDNICATTNLHHELWWSLNNMAESAAEVSILENFHAARPTTSFQDLREEMENFSRNIGSFESVFRQLDHLNAIVDQFKRKDLINVNLEHLQEASIWKKSLERFAGKLEKNYLIGFPDLVTPIIAAILNLHHGVSILIQQISNLRYESTINSDICYNLLRFPVTSLYQQNYLNLVRLCASEKMILLLVRQSGSKIVQKDRFSMTIIALHELENLSAVIGSDSKSISEELNKILIKIRIMWKEQEKQREEQAKEKESLFKMKSEKEEDEIDFRKMFPGFQQDFLELVEIFPGFQQEFPELQKLSNNAQSEKDQFFDLISSKDAREIQTIHWNILRNSAQGFSNNKNSVSRSARSKNQLDHRRSQEPDFVRPLAQRFEMLGPLIGTWPENLTSKLICSLNVLMSRKCSFETTSRDVYDFYKDPNTVEVEECQPYFEKLTKTIETFLTEWSENPILNTIKTIIERVLSFPINSSLLRFLVGVELLLTKIQQWEENARHDVSLSEFIEFFGKKILHWRRLELTRWKDSLEIVEDDMQSEASRWWFFLFDLVDQYLAEDLDHAHLEDSEAIKITGPTKEKIHENLERFLTESSLIQFEPRLQLIYLFYQHISMFSEGKRERELSAVFWNIYHYYSCFLGDVSNKIKTLKEPIANKLKDTIKITRWNDISYWSVKNTAEKTRRTLHKFVKEYQKGLLENVAAYLALKMKTDTLSVENKRELSPVDFLIQLKTGKLSRMEKVVRKARQFCQAIVVKSNYSQVRTDIESFIEDMLEESKRLKNLEVDKTLTKAKQKSLLKSMLQQKKMALANYFKSLNQLGLSYRIGILTWKNRKSEITCHGSMPLDLLEIQRFQFRKDLDENVLKGLFEQWSGCNKYYYESLIKLNFLDGILNSGRSDIGPQNAERCRGFSVHLTLLAHKQKELVFNLLKHFLPLKIQLSNLALMADEPSEEDACAEARQSDLQDLISNFQNLLQVLELSMKQVIVFLESCPPDSLEEENLLDLNMVVIPALKRHSVVEDSTTSMKDSLKLIQSLADQLNKWMTVSEKVKKSGHIFFFHKQHVDFLKTSYRELDQVKDNLVYLSSIFTVHHPITETLLLMVNEIDRNADEFEVVLSEPVTKENEKLEDVEVYKKRLDAMITQVLIAIQKKLQNSQKTSEETEESKKEIEESFEKNYMTERLIESLRTAIPDLKLRTVSKILRELLQITYQMDVKPASQCMRLLLEHMPLLKQYTLLLQYYLYEQVASFRLTCKFLYLQLNVFLDLATNGFCQQEDTDATEEDQDGGPSEGGMGLAEGEGKKDVSDRIESEDQLEDTKGPNDENKDNAQKDTKEEDKGIEMSENFESHLQDLEQDEEDKDKEEDDDLDKEMGETDETAEKLDQEMWKDDEEEENDEKEQGEENQTDKRGSGEETGQEEMGAKDGNEEKDETENRESEKEGQRKEEEKKEINEFNEPEMDDDQIDPYHGKQQPEIEPEAFDLPEDLTLDAEMKEDKETDQQEEDLFDIDKMKDVKMPEEPEESKEEESKEDVADEPIIDQDDSDVEEDPQADSDKKKDTKEANVEEDKEKDSEEQKMEEEQTKEDEKVSPSLDASSKEVDASEEVEARKDGSRDAVASQANDENMETDPTEVSADDTKDKGTGQSQTEKRQGHSGSKKEDNAPTSGEEKSSKPIEKRRKPGHSDENRSLFDDENQTPAKKLKTGLMREERDDHKEEENDAEKGGASETYEHIKKSEKFDEVVFDAATEEQIKKQASNLEVSDNEDTMDEESEDDDVEMYEDSEPEEQQEKVEKEQASKVPDNEKNKSGRGKGERSDDVEEVEMVGEVEGETAETSRVLRGTESTFHTKLSATDLYGVSTEDIAKKRSEIEHMLGHWTRQASSVEAANAWSSISALTESAARELSEKLRLVLEPTLTSRLKGDYRTGRRINMRKVIPYIASEFRKDKIWLRRTKPSKRDYQIVLAIDDSSSMADNHSKELAFESLSLIGKAMTYLEVGQLAVINFGEQVNILHPFGENFTEDSGAKLIQDMKFEQKKTMIAQLLEYAIDMFATQSSASDNAKLVTILSDGRGIFSEGVEKVTSAVRRAKLLNIFLVFIIVDNPLNKDSILDIRMPVFENGKLLGIRSYMDNFPFPFYIVLRDLNTLPVVLSDALRQWFEIVGRIDT